MIGSRAPAQRPAGRLGVAIAPAHLALIGLMLLIWSYNFIATKVALFELSPLLLAGLRFAIVAMVLLPFVPRPKRFAPVVAVALILGVGHFTLMFWALAITERIAPLAVTVQLNLPFAAFLAALLLGDHLGPRRLFGMVLAFAGVSWMSFDPGVFAELPSLMLATAAAFLWALGNVLAKRFAITSVFALNAYIGLIAGPTLLALSFLFEDGQIAALAGASLAAWGGVLYNALAVSVVSYAIWFSMLTRYPVNLVTPFTLLVPPMAALLSVWVFGEVLTLEVVLGGMVTLAGVGVVLIRRPELATERT